jgi:hypothetical protein
VVTGTGGGGRQQGRQEFPRSVHGVADGPVGDGFRRRDHYRHASMVELLFDAGKITFG